MKEKKNADKSPNIIIIICLPGRRQISKIGEILQKKRDREREIERVHINNDTELRFVLTWLEITFLQS